MSGSSSRSVFEYLHARNFVFPWHLSMSAERLRGCEHNQAVGGARGVMVIVAGYGHGDTSSNPGPDWLHFT